MPTTITIDNHTSPANSSRSASRSESFTDEEASSASGDHIISGSGSHSDSFEDWENLYSEELEPEDSASRPPRTSQRYRTSESRPPTSRAPTRRHTTAERSTRRPPPASRVHRHPVPAPPSSVDPEDYPGYGRGFPAPPAGPYGGGRLPPGYAPSSYSSPAPGGTYAPPYGAPGALAHYGPPGGFPQQYPASNPFSPHTAPPTGGAGYFNGGHHAMSGPNTPAPYEHAMMPYPPPPMAGYGFPGGYQPPQMHQQQQQQQQQQHMPPYYPQQWPPSDGSGTGDPELEKKLLAVEELMKAQKIDYEKAQQEIASRDAAAAARQAAELEAKHKAEAAALAAARAAEERASWEKKLEEEKKKAEEEKAAWEKKFEEEKKAAQARGAENAKKQIEADRKKAEEKAADEKAKADAKAAVIKAEADAKAAVAKAESEAKAAIEKAEKESKEAVLKAEKEAKEAVEKAEKEAKESVEKAEKDAQESISKALAPKDEKKKPLKFKDAVGRKFSFPFHLCTTWEGMEELIKQAFLHVDVIGPQVQQGHYDLIGPNGEIILPQVWATMIEPDWAITMHMWPMPEKAAPGPPPGGFPPGHPFHDRPRSRHEGRHSRHGPPPNMPPPPGHRGGGGGGGGAMPPPPPGWPPGVPPGMIPPPRPGGGPPGPRPGEPPIIVMPSGSGPPRPSRRKPDPPKGMLGWMTGKQTKPSGKGPKKYDQQDICRVM